MSKAFLGPVAAAAVRAGRVKCLVELTLFGSACFRLVGDPGEVREASCKSKALKQGRGLSGHQGKRWHSVGSISALILIGWKADSEMLQI